MFGPTIPLVRALAPDDHGPIPWSSQLVEFVVDLREGLAGMPWRELISQPWMLRIHRAHATVIAIIIRARRRPR